MVATSSSGSRWADARARMRALAALPTPTAMASFESSTPAWVGEGGGGSLVSAAGRTMLVLPPRTLSRDAASSLSPLPGVLSGAPPGIPRSALMSPLCGGLVWGLRGGR